MNAGTPHHTPSCGPRRWRGRSAGCAAGSPETFADVYERFERRRRHRDRGQGDDDRQSILSFAVSEDLVEYNDAAGVTKPRYERAREPHIFLPPEVEAIRAQLDLRDGTLVSVLAYSRPCPEEVVCRLAWSDVGEHAIRYQDTKRHRIRHTPLLKPLADDLTEWCLASGRPTATRPVFPARDGGFWQQDDWRNWRQRIWQGEPARPRRDRKNPIHPRPGRAPKDTRPRDLRSSYVTSVSTRESRSLRSVVRSARASG
jgi:integrase